ncbi:hypothetical protein ACOMHN_030621 [Nucella lapillus]
MSGNVMVSGKDNERAREAEKSLRAADDFSDRAQQTPLSLTVSSAVVCVYSSQQTTISPRNSCWPTTSNLIGGRRSRRSLIGGERDPVWGYADQGSVCCGAHQGAVLQPSPRAIQRERGNTNT